MTSWNLKDMQVGNVKVMSTFSCGGGSSMGYKLAGCDVIAANDIDPEMAWHYKHNLHPKYYYLCPVKELLTKELPRELYELDILDGSPPCSSFSMAGSREKYWGTLKKFREGQSKQVLDDLFFDYISLVDRLKPKIAIAENVKGLIQGKAKGYAKLIFEGFKNIGYNPQLFLINAADCGVPQKRERVFFVALRDNIKKPKLTLSFNEKWISAEDAIKDLTLGEESLTLTPAHKKYYPIWGEGEDLADVYERLGEKRRSFSEHKLKRDLPSCTLTSKQNHFIHWEEPRYLSYNEWKRLGSFPDDYKCRNIKIGKYIIGMSVPPFVMKKIAEAVLTQWLA